MVKVLFWKRANAFSILANYRRRKVTRGTSDLRKVEPAGPAGCDNWNLIEPTPYDFVDRPGRYFVMLS